MSAGTALPTTAPDTPEEAAVRETVRDIAARCADSAADSGDHAECWSRLEAAGLLELRCADTDGSPLADTTMTALVVQEAAGSVCGAPLLGVLLGTELLRLAGGAPLDEPATVLLDADLSGLGDGASGVAWDAGEPVRRAVGLDRTDGTDGAGVVVVELGDRTASQDLSRPTAQPLGDAVDLGLRLESADRARFESFARLLLVADILGSAGGVLAEAVGHAADRVQFGRPIGSFQAVQHLCARAYGEVEAVRSALLYGAWSLDDGRDHVEPSLVAKAYGGDAGVRVAQAAVQVFGGVAITWEFPAHRHLRRVLLDRVVLGDPASAAGQLLDAVQHGGHDGAGTA